MRRPPTCRFGVAIIYQHVCVRRTRTAPLQIRAGCKRAANGGREFQILPRFLWSGARCAVTLMERGSIGIKFQKQNCSTGGTWRASQATIAVGFNPFNRLIISRACGERSIEAIYHDIEYVRDMHRLSIVRAPAVVIGGSLATTDARDHSVASE